MSEELKEFEELLQTNEVYRDVLGKWGAEITRNIIKKMLASQREEVVEEIRKKFGKAFFTACFYATKKDMESLDPIILENHMKLFLDSLSPNRKSK